MKTAEVAIEHILVGLLALCAFVLPLFSGLYADPKLPQSEALISIIGIGILGMAYLLGVVFDKLADTVLSPIEQWLRLSRASKNLDKGRSCYDRDPFPQDVLEFSLRGKQDGRVEWMDSLRSRIRTSRGLAVLGLPAAMGIAIYLNLMKESGVVPQTSLNRGPYVFAAIIGVVPQISSDWWPRLALAINILLISASVFISSRKMRRTDELCKNGHKRKRQMDEAKRQMWLRTLPYIVMLFISAVIVGLIAASRTTPFKSAVIAVIGVCGAVASLLALWTWYYITETYMSFVYQKLPELLSEKDENLHKGNLA